jgi:hypothetical protein
MATVAPDSSLWCSDGARMFGAGRAQTRLFQHDALPSTLRPRRNVERSARTSAYGCPSARTEDLRKSTRLIL